MTHGQRPPRYETAEGEPTYRCPDCLDMGYVSHPLHRHGLVYSVSWFCDCHQGRTQEAGYWFEQCYPWEGNQRMQSDRGEAKLAEYLKAKPDRNAWLRDGIEACRLRHEERRKRRLRSLQERREAMAVGMTD